MSTSKASADSGNDRDADDAPPHASGQLPATPPVGGSASGPGTCAHGGFPAGHRTHAEEAVPETPTEGVDLSTIEDPAATAAAFASVGQLLVTQEIISAATAKHIFQGELNLAEIKSTAAAAAAPFLPGDVPPARFGVQQDPSSFVVGVPAKHTDHLSDKFLRDGYGGLEALTFVEALSDEDIQDLTEMTDSRCSVRPELLLPWPAEFTATVPELRELLGSLDARRELASLLQHYPVEDLSRKVFKMPTLLKRTLEQLRETKRQLRSNGSRDGAELLAKLTEISSMKTGFALLNQHWKDSFITSKLQLDQEISDHAGDFKRAAQIHEQEEEALQSKIAAITQESDDMFAYARSLKRQLKAGSLNVPRVMNFLKTRVVGNWPRLKALLEQLKDHKTPPSDWTTQIIVTAIDDYSAQPGPFATLDEEDADEEGKKDSGTGPTSGSKSAPLDFTQDSTPPSTPQTPPTKQRK
ncbi:hypothetical protein PR001_g21594 [Phytophthora rubi]|uniref:Uncharacterized protein n=1 Tax=Phytophthora rubi TaxID=129364 RepID=A0A6A3ITL6_9STRA|nr:hypothetical protein PR002_g22670 [Phytophthora rubi]KAE8990078.1 hypothetical protein PR001_g21594 [Phytophthora rubi]